MIYLFKTTINKFFLICKPTTQYKTCVTDKFKKIRAFSFLYYFIYMFLQIIGTTVCQKIMLYTIKQCLIYNK